MNGEESNTERTCIKDENRNAGVPRMELVNDREERSGNGEANASVWICGWATEIVAHFWKAEDMCVSRLCFLKAIDA